MATGPSCPRRRPRAASTSVPPSLARGVPASGIDWVFGEPNAFGLGFGIDENGLGMGGLGGSYGAASRQGYAIAFLTGSMGSFDRATKRRERPPFLLGLGALVD
jgi:hypothetical protein